MISAISAGLKVTVLLIAGCTGGTDIDSPEQGVCPVSNYVESWSGVASQQECDEYIRSKAFDPEEYLPGWDSYVVRCEPKPTTL
ncbi:hypothetical protein hairong_145 [Pseudomonas phage hairong]|nr:hypothetical protein hairong_145 [Pseudomonas phage hairong]